MDNRVELALNKLLQSGALDLFDDELGQLEIVGKVGGLFNVNYWDHCQGRVDLAYSLEGVTESKVRQEVQSWFRLLDKIDAL